MQRGQLRARVDAEFVVEAPAQILVAVQRLGLPSRAVQRAQVSRAQPLAQRMGRHERGEFSRDLPIFAQ